MAKIRLVDGTELNITNIELVKGNLRISTTEKTVEELAALFSDKGNISLIVLLTDGGVETGFKAGFTNMAGINYVDGEKTVELFQPVDTTETRLANAETSANLAIKQTETNCNDITDVQMALAELYEMITALAADQGVQ